MKNPLLRMDNTFPIMCWWRIFPNTEITFCPVISDKRANGEPHHKLQFPCRYGCIKKEHSIQNIKLSMNIHSGKQPTCARLLFFILKAYQPMLFVRIPYFSFPTILEITSSLHLGIPNSTHTGLLVGFTIIHTLGSPHSN